MTHSYAFAAGAYRATWNALALGQAEDGIHFETSVDCEAVVGDNLGSTVQDLIYRGVSVYISGMFIEPGAAGLLAPAGKKPHWPWSATFGKVDVVGLLATTGGVAEPLVLTAVSGSSAYYTSITAANTVLAPNSPVDQWLGVHAHKIPLRFQILPGGSLDAEIMFSVVVPS